MSLTEWLADCEEIEEWNALRLDADSPAEHTPAALWAPTEEEPPGGAEVTALPAAAPGGVGETEANG